MIEDKIGVSNKKDSLVGTRAIGVLRVGKMLELSLKSYTKTFQDSGFKK